MSNTSSPNFGTGEGLGTQHGRHQTSRQLRDHFELLGPRAARQNVVIVQHGAKRAGLVVDVPHGAVQTVIKPLAHLLKDVFGASSSAILVNGRGALILDVPRCCAVLKRKVMSAG
jgi:chemotaxis protein histidine kinase CheA